MSVHSILERARMRVPAGENYWFTRYAKSLIFLILILSIAGIYVASNPSSSFFYVLTAAHAVHLLGGVGALVWVDFEALRLRLGPAKRTAIDITAIFWHFLVGVWIFLMILFYVWG